MIPPGVLDKPNLVQRYQGIAKDRLVGLWPLNETSGLVARCANNAALNGVHSGVSLGGYNYKGLPAPSYDGSNDYTDYYSAALNSGFDGQLFSAVLLLNPVTASLTDSAENNALRLYADAMNYLRFYITTGNSFLVTYEAADTVKGAAVSLSGDVWQSIGISVDFAGDSGFIYKNGVQEGAELTGLGEWAGALDTIRCCVGASSTSGTSVWNGGLSLFALYSGVLSAEEWARWAA